MKQNSTVKEQSLNPQPTVRSTPQPEAPESLDDRVLAALQRRNLVRYSWNETSPGQAELQVLPTVLYVMPFAGLEAWAVQMEKFGLPDAKDETEVLTPDEPQQS